jgi:hypothetical protein
MSDTPLDSFDSQFLTLTGVPGKIVFNIEGRRFLQVLMNTDHSTPCWAVSQDGAVWRLLASYTGCGWTGYNCNLQELWPEDRYSYRIVCLGLLTRIFPQ